MMDRSKALNLPNDQINFIKYICLPAYELVTKGLPNTKEMLVNVKYVVWTAAISPRVAALE